MSEFINEKMRDKAGTEHNYKYKRNNNKFYPADLAYNNKETGFRIYFVYDNDFGNKVKGKVSVFESTDEDGNKVVMEAPEADVDSQAVVRTMIMF